MNIKYGSIKPFCIKILTKYALNFAQIFFYLKQLSKTQMPDCLGLICLFYL